MDIGDPSVQGWLKKQAGRHEIVAGTEDIWGVRDQFHFAYTLHSGDFDFKVRLESLDMPHLYTKAGLMARATLDADSPHVYMMVFPDNRPRNKNNGGCEFQFREVAGGENTAIYPDDYTTEPPEFPVRYPNTWLRLKRSGDDFTAFYSSGGQSWKIYTQITKKFSKKIFLGLAITSHAHDAATTAVLNDISLV
ncbi:DUF1349 domain-containing protein [Paenibacillus sp. RC67]|uniref:DUF1349 domain-containing protein n=1 Tax=Paenibacillus sp. RC67 TaxID=3039392 RepID=UPI0024ACD5B1|nr:DUF1349 domain-containing protein [Paenibacillus sp. RC67]